MHRFIEQALCSRSLAGYLANGTVCQIRAWAYAATCVDGRLVR